MKELSKAGVFADPEQFYKFVDNITKDPKIRKASGKIIKTLEKLAKKGTWP